MTLMRTRQHACAITHRSAKLLASRQRMSSLQSTPLKVSTSVLRAMFMTLMLSARLDSWLKYCSACSPTLAAAPSRHKPPLATYTHRSIRARTGQNALSQAHRRLCTPTELGGLMSQDATQQASSVCDWPALQIVLTLMHRQGEGGGGVCKNQGSAEPLTLA